MARDAGSTPVDATRIAAYSKGRASHVGILPAVGPGNLGSQAPLTPNDTDLDVAGGYILVTPFRSTRLRSYSEGSRIGSDRSHYGMSDAVGT
jgi:hypothetical protein